MKKKPHLPCKKSILAIVGWGWRNSLGKGKSYMPQFTDFLLSKPAKVSCFGVLPLSVICISQVHIFIFYICEHSKIHVQHDKLLQTSPGGTDILRAVLSLCGRFRALAHLLPIRAMWYAATNLFYFMVSFFCAVKVAVILPNSETSPLLW